MPKAKPPVALAAYQPPRRQRPLSSKDGGRIPVSAGLEARLEAALRELSIRHHASRPLVVTTLLCKALGLSLEAEDAAAPRSEMTVDERRILKLVKKAG